MKNNYYIYFHINLVSNEVFYVGKGNCRRAWNKSTRSQYWKRIVNKYGYRVDIIHENLSEKRAFDWEKLYISMFGRKNLVNHTDGGEGQSGFKHSKESKEKTSKSLMGRISPNKGKTASEETRKKLSEVGKNRTYSDETRKKMSDAKKGKVSNNKKSSK